MNAEEGLRALRRRIKLSGAPKRERDDLVTIATWNIREFGRRRRRPESLRYIAEIIRQFDLVAIVELRDDLHDFFTVLEHLGPRWARVYSDFIPDAGGNHERLGFLFDTSTIEHTGLASQACPPRKRIDSEYLPQIGWWRPPFIASFKCRGRELCLVTAHIRWAGDDEMARLPEIELLADWVHRRSQEDWLRHADLFVLGDFNIPSVESPLFRAIVRRGLVAPKVLLGAHGTNLAMNKRYDQILHLPGRGFGLTGLGGELDFYSGGGIGELYGRARIDEREFTYEMSDHLPLWCQVRVVG